MIYKNYKQQPIFVVLIALGLSLGLPGCAKQTSAAERSVGYHETRDKVSLHAHKLGAQESYERFGANLMEGGYQPINLTLYNDSDDVLLLRASSIDLPLEPAYDAAYASHWWTKTATIYPAYYSAVFYWPALFPIAGAGVWMSYSNQKITSSTKACALEADRVIEILPYERISRDIFVKTDVPSSYFSMSLFNLNQKSFIPFNVKLA